MLWIDVALRTAALASTVIATLRAGSRGAYLLQHDAIGIMEGPLIGPSTTPNETNPLFELSEAFRHCVRLCYAPRFYENVRTNQRVLTVVEPYPLYPRPYLVGNESEQSSVTGNATESNSTLEALHDLNRNVGKATNLLEYRPPTVSFLRRQVKRTMNAVTSNVQYSKDTFAMTSQIFSYWARRIWYWRTWREEEATSLDWNDLAIEEDWDYEFSTEAELRFESPEARRRIAELTVFSPESFESMRSLFGISEESYKQSIFGTGPFVSFQSNSKGAARAGGVFFFTRDGAYMIKTVKKEDAKTFLKMLPRYHRHMKRHGRTSLLTRFCGMYGVRIYDEDSADHGRFQTFVVMNAVFPAEGSRFIAEKFDLKGSTIGREVSEEELQTKGRNAVLKDLDLAREVQLVQTIDQAQHGLASPAPIREYGLHIGVATKAALLSQLREDVKLLVDCQVMDYSLLVGVVNMETHMKLDKSARNAMIAIEEQRRKLSKSKKWEDKALYAIGTPLRLICAPPMFVARQIWSFGQRTLSSVVTLPLPYYGSGICGVDGGSFSILQGRRGGDRAVYYLGLIDFLQPWTTRKVLERKLKGMIGMDTKAISCVTPEEYAARFLEFLDVHIS